MTRPELTVFEDAEALARYAANWLLETALAKKGRFAVALSGGSTPKRLYTLLASPPWLGQFPWRETHWFWGDERFVPQDDALSNYRMVREAMLSHAPAPPQTIHPMPTEHLTPDEAASTYEAALKNFYGHNRLNPAQPLFDVNLLGLGEDGHTASLFPGSEALREQDRWVVPVVGARAEDRITLTYPALNSSRYAVFLVTGAEKQGILARLMAGDTGLPSTHIAPAGSLMIFADEAAAGGAL